MMHKKKTEGAAMFVVMMIILTGTAAALFGVRMATGELQGTGFAGKRDTVGDVAETALFAGINYLDTMGADAIIAGIRNNAARCQQNPDCGATGSCDTSCPFQGDPDNPNIGTIEPPLAPGEGVFRITPAYMDQLANGTALAKFGVNPFARRANDKYMPYAMIDFYELKKVTRPIAGMDLTGRSEMSLVEMKITARGRLLLDSDHDGVVDDIADDTREDLNEFNNVAARTARAYIVTGPSYSM
ncbi:MAG: hypothetical protein R3A47_10150 [Polyangiales bacterium]